MITGDHLSNGQSWKNICFFFFFFWQFWTLKDWDTAWQNKVCRRGDETAIQPIQSNISMNQSLPSCQRKDLAAFPNHVKIISSDNEVLYLDSQFLLFTLMLLFHEDQVTSHCLVHYSKRYQKKSQNKSMSEKCWMWFSCKAECQEALSYASASKDLNCRFSFHLPFCAKH